MCVLSMPMMRNILLIVVLCMIHTPWLAVEAFYMPFLALKKARARSSSRVKVAISSAKTSISNTQEGSQSNIEGGNNLSSAELQAEELRKRAKELMAEARAMELELGDTRTDTSKRRKKESDNLCSQLFAGNATSVQISERLIEERWSPDQLTLVLERLHAKQVVAIGRNAGGSAGSGFQIGSTNNRAEPDEEEWKRLDAQIESLIEAASILDDQTTGNVNANQRWTGRVASSLRSQLKELRRTDELEFQRKVAASVNVAVIGNVSVQEYVRGTLGMPVIVETEDKNGNSLNISLIMEKVAMIPMWIPSSLLTFLVVSKTRLEPEDFKTIRDDVLSGTSFYVTSTDSIPAAAIFRGNIRSPLGVVNATMERNQTAVVFQDIQNRLDSAGCGNRIQLFLLNDPEWQPGKDSREPTPKPVVLALPSQVVPEQSSEAGYASLALKTISVSATMLTTLAYSISCYALNPNFFSSVVEKHDVSILIACFPIFVGVLAIQAIHEAAQYLMAKRAGLKIGLPVLLPSFQIGTFGSIVPMRSFPVNRSALLDFSLSGPLAGMLISVITMAGGILATVYASTDALVQFPFVPVALLKASYLVGSMLSLLAPKTMILPSSQPVPVHPLFVIGFAGLISNALNMLPIGRLDGGRAYSAVFGTRNASIASLLLLGFLSLLSLTGMSTIAIFWGLFVVLLQRQADIPVRDEVTDVDDLRVKIYVGTLALSLLALAPFPTGQGML